MRKDKKIRKRRGGFLKKIEDDQRKDYFSELFKAGRKKAMINLFVKKLKQIIVQKQCPNLDNISLNQKQKMEESETRTPKIPKII